MVLAWNIPQRKIETFVYDFNDRLRVYAGYSFSTGLKQGIYLYDALGRRFQKRVGTQTTRFFSDGWSTLFETNLAGTLGKSYVLGPRIDEILQSTGQNYLYDGLGSVAGLANSSGVKTATYGYDVFGALRFKSGTAANANNYLFTGRELDPESTLYNYRNRYYNPSVGRFLTKDPIGLRGGVNYYSYVFNNPISWIDPWGLGRIGSRTLDSSSIPFNGSGPLRHDQIWYDDDSNSGFFNDDTIRSDYGHNRKEYDFSRDTKYYDDCLLKLAEGNVQRRWDKDWRMPLWEPWNWNNCQDYVNAVRAEYNTLEQTQAG